MTIQQALAQFALEFASLSDSPRLDAELLLCRVLQCQRSYLYAWPERVLDSTQQALLVQLAGRRSQGEPIAHILGEREFWSLSLQVNPATLIPRPETELLVEAALARIPLDAAWDIADLGTGSGAIALAIASERPACRLHAVDQSAEAVVVAEANARRLGLHNLRFYHGHWFAPLAGQCFAMILSNPPYIRADDPHLEQGDVRFEPRTALVAEEEGLADIRQIIAQAPAYLQAPGWLLLEHGWDQGEAVLALLRQYGFDDCEDLPDLLGHGRVGLGRWG